MADLWLTDEHALQILQHAAQSRPEEACGIVAGRDGRAHQVIPVANVAADRQSTYEMDPAALALLLPELDAQGSQVLAFYHSHPEGSPRPSVTDVRDASYPDVLYVIVGMGGNSPEIGAWHITDGRVLPADLHVGRLPPAPTPDPFQLSRARHAAILISVVLALALLIVISLQLLPPAPPLPIIH